MARHGEYTMLEIGVGSLTILLVTEGARRATGALLPILGILALIFAYEGIVAEPSLPFRPQRV